MVGRKFFYVQTYECKMSSYFGNVICGFFEQNGYKKTSEKTANIIIVNTCVFDRTREDISLSLIKNFSGKGFAKKTVVVCGCLPKIEAVRKKIEESKNLVMIGPKELHRFNSLFNVAVSIEKIDGNMVESVSHIRNGCEEGKYYILISQGCSNKCAYCIIKQAKDFVFSKPVNQIIAEFERGLGFGFKDFVLLSDDCGSYGVDIGTDLAALLNRIAKMKGDFKLEINYFEPHRLQLLFKKIKKPAFNRLSAVCIPLQSASQRLIGLMNRNYDVKNILDMIKKIKRFSPAIRINTHLMFCYPGETRIDFLLNMALVGLDIFDNIGFFCYSDREGTAASKAAGKVSPDEKIKRIEMVSKMCAQNKKCVFNYPRNLDIKKV